MKEHMRELRSISARWRIFAGPGIELVFVQRDAEASVLAYAMERAKPSRSAIRCGGTRIRPKWAVRSCKNAA